MMNTRRSLKKSRVRISRAAIGRRRAEVHDLILAPMGELICDTLPTSVILVHSGPKDPSQEQLFIDHVPVPRHLFRYDPHDKVISWDGIHGGGHIYLAHDGTGGVGNVGKEDMVQAVSAGARAIFDCSVALNVGAAYINSGGQAVGLSWDTSSAAWRNADWASDKDRLRLTYTVTPQGPIMPPKFTFTFADQITKDDWAPTEDSFEASLKLSHKDGRMDWALMFKSETAPPKDIPESGGSTAPKDTPDSVYPYWLQANEDAAAATINGVLEIDKLAPNGTLVGLQGERASLSAAGYYTVSNEHAPFAVFGGQLYVGDQAVSSSVMQGRNLRWCSLPDDVVDKSGLPSEGSITFNADGSAGRLSTGVVVQRLAAQTAHDAVAAHAHYHPETHAKFMAMAEAAEDSDLTIYGLMAMQSFAQNAKGEWSDVIQTAVTNDMSTIMNSFIPSKMWDLLFPSMHQSTLTGELAVVANTPVAGAPKPADWYSELATSVLVQGMAKGSDPACKFMNGPRAAAWLKTEVASSKVYYTHSQLLFHYQWQQQFPLTAQYQQDQISNATKYATIIDQQVALDVADIKKNVVTDSNSPADLKQKMIAQVQDAGNFAKQNNLYWAFAFYTYNTAPSILTNIALQMGLNTGSSDGMTLTRMFQQNAAVLTALDPSGFFSKKYTDTISTFLTTNIVPSMYSFENNSTTFDIIKEYLEQFVQSNLNNEDQQIQQAAQQLAAILADENADEMLHNSIEALVSFSEAIDEALAFPYVAKKFVGWFEESYPKFATVGSVFGTVLMTGIAGLSLFNMLSEFKQWNKLTTAQKAEVITNTIQMGIQFVAMVVKRGIRIYALYTAEGLTKGARAAGISRIMLQGESEDLDAALARIGNTTARWLGDTEGSLGMGGTGEAEALLAADASTEAEEVSMAVRVFGKNLDEFVATRIGPIFILAGIGFSIYQIASGDQGIALASDILNIVGGSLMLFATIGGWLVEGGIIAAEGTLAVLISAAGPLAIVLALVGVGLMIYQMFKKPPDPVQEFVDQYAKPKGLAVSSQATAIDYVQVYANKDNNDLLMIGCTLSQNGALQAQNAGAITSVLAVTPMPDCVWQVDTDGSGMSKIFTVIQPDPKAPPLTRYLSHMSDGSVIFAEKIPASGQMQNLVPVGTPTPSSQTWFFTPTAAATVNSEGELLSMPGTLQIINPDAQGNYTPSGAGEYLNQSGSGVALGSKNATSSWGLQMSGIAPNYIRRPDISFVFNSIPATSEKYSPVFGVRPSTPLTKALSGKLPAFLTFSATTGQITPNGKSATPAGSSSVSETVTNQLGSEQVDFSILVKSAVAS